MVRIRTVRNTGNLCGKCDITADQHAAHLVASKIRIALSDTAGIIRCNTGYTLRHALIRAGAECDNIVSAVQEFFQTVKVEAVIVLIQVDNICVGTLYARIVFISSLNQLRSRNLSIINRRILFNIVRLYCSA